MAAVTTSSTAACRRRHYPLKNLDPTGSTAACRWLQATWRPNLKAIIGDSALAAQAAGQHTYRMRAARCITRSRV